MILSAYAELTQRKVTTRKGCHTNSSSLENSYHALDKRCPFRTLSLSERRERKCKQKFPSPHITVGKILLSLDTLTQPEAISIVHVFLFSLRYNRSQSNIRKKMGSDCTEGHGRSQLDPIFAQASAYIHNPWL